MSTVTIANTPITCFEDLNKVSTADLLAYYNSITGKTTKQFLKRAKGMQQVWALVEPQLAQVEEPAPAEVVKPAQPEPAEAAPTTHAAASSSVEEALTANKAAGLKTQVGTLVEALSSGPRSVADITQALGLANEKRARSLIDTARRLGHSIACVGRGTFALASNAGE
jgi:hypothetical protein